MTIARCPACAKTYTECVCATACQVCGVVTNHTTKQHEDVLREQEEGEA